MKPNVLNPFLVLALVIVFISVTWCVILIATGIASGWSKLAVSYRLAEPFEGKLWHFQSARFRWGMKYDYVLTVGANADGLYIKPMLPFRLGHPPLVIPWSETKIAMTQSIWLGECMEIQFPNVPGTVIRFPEKLAKPDRGGEFSADVINGAFG